MQDDENKSIQEEVRDEEDVNVSDLDDLQGVDGEELDTVEKDQDPTKIKEDNESPREQLEEIIRGDDNDPDALFNE